MNAGSYHPSFIECHPPSASRLRPKRIVPISHKAFSSSSIIHRGPVRTPNTRPNRGTKVSEETRPSHPSFFSSPQHSPSPPPNQALRVTTTATDDMRSLSAAGHSSSEHATTVCKRHCPILSSSGLQTGISGDLISMVQGNPPHGPTRSAVRTRAVVRDPVLDVPRVSVPGVFREQAAMLGT